LLLEALFFFHPVVVQQGCQHRLTIHSCWEHKGTIWWDFNPTSLVWLLTAAVFNIFYWHLWFYVKIYLIKGINLVTL
jgi:hypothetical protein